MLHYRLLYHSEFPVPEVWLSRGKGKPPVMYGSSTWQKRVGRAAGHSRERKWRDNAEAQESALNAPVAV